MALDISSMHDLAGSTVIHSTGGWALLAAIMIIGNRHDRFKNGKIKVIPASNIPLVALEAFLLWIGWFGFKGGSVGSISSKESADTVALTIMNTNTAGLAGAIIVVSSTISNMVYGGRWQSVSLVIHRSWHTSKVFWL